VAKNRDLVTEFHQSKPKEAKNYIFIHPVSVDLYKDMFNVVHEWNAASTVGWLKDHFGDAEGVSDFADSLMNRVHRAQRMWEKDLDELTAASLGGGAVCEYKWSDGKTTELGLIVLKEGRIVKRFPFSNAVNLEDLAESTPVE